MTAPGRARLYLDDLADYHRQMASRGDIPEEQRAFHRERAGTYDEEANAEWRGMNRRERRHATRKIRGKGWTR